MLSKLSKLFPSVKKWGSNPASRWQTLRTRCIYSSPASVQGVKKLSSRKSASFGLARLAGQRCSAQAIEKEQRNKGVTVSDSLSARLGPAYPIPNMILPFSSASTCVRLSMFRTVTSTSGKRSRKWARASGRNGVHRGDAAEGEPTPLAASGLLGLRHRLLGTHQRASGSAKKNASDLRE